MDSWMQILIELGILALIGLIYYVIQKRRIIYHDKNEIFHKLDELHYVLNEFLHDKDSEAYYASLNEFIGKLDDILQYPTIEGVITLIDSFPQVDVLPEDIMQKLNEIREQMNFHRVSKGSSN